MLKKPALIFVVVYLLVLISILIVNKNFDFLLLYYYITSNGKPYKESQNIQEISDRKKYELFNEGKINAPLTPQLYVDGPYLRRKDTGESVQLKGVTTMAFVYYDYETTELLYKLGKVKEWGINLLGLFLNYDKVKNKYDQLDEVINWAEKNGIYVYLMPAVNKYNTNPRLSTQISLFPLMMKELANKYVNRTNILYGLWAEPRLVFWDEWIDKANNTAQGIREVNPNSVILVTGLQFGRYFYIDQKPFTFKNIIYDYHDYPFADSEDARKHNGINPDGILWDKMIGRVPILIGEFGGVYQGNFGSDEDINYIKLILNNINENRLHYTAYTLDDEGTLGLIDWKTGKPTRKGKIIHEDLIKYSPTFID